MTLAIAVTSSAELSRRLRLAADDDLIVLRPEQLPAGPAQLVALTEDPDAVRALIFDVGEGQCDPGEVLDLISRVDRAGLRGVSSFVVTDRGEDLALDALRAGVRNIIEPGTDVDDLRLIIRSALDAADGGWGPDSREHSGRVVTIASPKGGVGKTTVSTNIALSLAEQSPQGTVLVDLDVQFGDVSSALDLEPVYTLGDVISSGVPDMMSLKALLTQHRSGLQVVCGVGSPVEADQIDARRIGDLVEVLKREFRFVVIDSAPGMSEETLAALDHTTDLVLVTTVDVPGVRGMRKSMELMEQLDLPPHTRHLVLNMVERGSNLSVSDAEAILGRTADVVLHRSPKVARSTNQGSPLVAEHPGDAFSRSIVGLSRRFAPVTSRRDRRAGSHRLWGRS